MAELDVFQDDPTIGQFVKKILPGQTDARSFDQYESCCTAIGALGDLCFGISTPVEAVADFLQTTGQKAEDLQTHLHIWGSDVGWAAWSSQEKLSFEKSVLQKSVSTAIRSLREHTHEVANLVVELASSPDP